MAPSGIERRDSADLSSWKNNVAYIAMEHSFQELARATRIG
jgi:hypothetical protein